MNATRVKKMLEKSMEYMIYVWIFLLPLQTRYIFSYKEINKGITEFGTKSIYVTEVLWMVVLALFLAVFLIEQLVEKKKLQKLSKESITLCAFLIVVFVSLYFSEEKDTALLGFLRFFEGVTVFFLVKKQNIQLKKILVSLCISVVIVGILGIVQFLAQHIFPSTWFGIAIHDPSILGDSVVETQTMRFLRSYGTLPHPNMFGAFMGLGLIMSAGLLWGEKKIVKRMLVWIALVIATSGVILSGSRATWIALICAGVWGGIMWISKYKTRTKSLVEIVLVFIVICIFWIAVFPEFIQTRIFGQQRLEIKSIEERIDSYADARSILEDNWVQGVGIHSYIAKIEKENPEKEAWEYQPVHNTYVQIAIETGVFGLILYVIFLLDIAKKVYRENPQSIAFLIFILVAGLWDHFWWTLPWGMSMLFLILGIVTKSLQNKKE